MLILLCIRDSTAMAICQLAIASGMPVVVLTLLVKKVRSRNFCCVQGNLQERKDSPDPQSNVFGSLLTTFGSVEVGGRNFYKLMKQGECVLLYPGGVREVCLSKALYSSCERDLQC